MWFTRVSINNPIFATMVMVAIIVLGIFSYSKLGIQQFPNINLPTVMITTYYPNASPAAVENDVTEKIEDAVNTIGGIDTIQSKSYQGRSMVIVKFNLETNANVDVANVRDQISAIEGTLNDNVKTPIIKQLDPDAQPVVSISVTSTTRSLRYLSDLVKNTVLKRLEDVDGVGQANIIGDRTEQVNIDVNPQKLNYYHLSVSDVINALQSDSQNFPTGTIKKNTTETNVQIESAFARVIDFNNIVVARRGNQAIYLGQVATIEDGMAEQQTAALIDGHPAVTIDIVKTDEANTVEVAQQIRQRVGDLQNELPKDVNVKVIKDSSVGIKASVDNVKETIIEGALLTMLVVFLFLSSWRSTVITSLTLPISVIGAFIAIEALGFSINNITLMALSLSIGILIDDAIVVRENISRHILQGKSHYDAALDGTKEIGLAVLATTSTLVAVFLPVAYMQGIVGRMFYQFGITVAVSVLISLFVSYTIDPMLSSIWYDPHLHTDKQPPWLQRFTNWREAQFDRFTDFYSQLLQWCLQHRLKTLLFTVIALFASFFLVHFIGKEFIPSADLGEVSVVISAPQGSSLDYTANKVTQVQNILKQIPDVDYSYGTINTQMAIGTNHAVVYAELKAKKQRQYSAQELVNIIRDKLQHMAGLEVMVAISDPFGRTQRSLQVSIRGPSLEVLAGLANQVVALMKDTPGFVDIDNSLDNSKPVIDLMIKRKTASDLGVTTQAIYNVVQPLLSGKTVGTWLGPDDNNHDVVVQLADENRKLIDNIKNLYVTSNQGDANGQPIMVPLSQLVNISVNTMPGEIDRRNLSREALISANVRGISEGDASMQLYKKLDTLQFPRGYSFTSEGNAKKMAESANYAAQALGLAVIFIYIILASQFASFTQPLVIMASLPLSLIGVFIALFLTRSTLNMFSVIGCIMLMGLVTKNAILLVDFINVGMKAGLERTQAILDAGKVRMRPILMTTFAMLFGMIPLALGIGVGAEQRMSMAQAIIGGIITSTVLTLVIIPVLFTYIDEWSHAVKRRFVNRIEAAEKLTP